MANLLNQFYLLANNTINIHFKNMIDYNFGLAFQVFNEENNFFDSRSFRRRRFICNGFIERYYKYKAKFETYLYMTFSDEFLNLLEKFYYKLRDDILNHVKHKLIFKYLKINIILIKKYIKINFILLSKRIMKF